MISFGELVNTKYNFPSSYYCKLVIQRKFLEKQIIKVINMN